MLGTVIVIITVVAAAAAVLWLRMSAPEAPVRPATQDQQRAQQIRRDEPLPITIYYPSEGMLAPGPAVVKRQPDTQSLARESLAVLFADQRASQAPALRDLSLREFYLDASGTAYIDLTPGSHKDVRASAWEEQLAIYAMVNTLQRNFEEIKQVVVLLDGREAQTLAGHMDLSRAFTKRMELVK